jgi:ribulose-5-phosphate 4-epimerase/fuculose-1-phosphate aldolase
MRGHPVVICRGHGITSTAATVQQAVLQAISIDALARMSLQVRSAGGTLRDIGDCDWHELPDLGPGFTTDAAWRSEVARLHPATMQWGHPQPRSGEGDAQHDEEKPGSRVQPS